MKTFLKIIGIVILLIVAYAVVAILFFSKKYHFERSVVINGPKEKVWQNVGSLQAFNVWNPFSKADKNIVITYKGAGDQVGDSYHWIGNKEVGEGEQKITAIVPGEKVTSEIHFIKPYEGEATINMMLTPEGNGTKVTWSMDNELNTMMKLMKPMMDGQMGKMFDQGLADLKKVSE
ncbi:SRPBCC family protein [Chryseobacterium sp.]|uniref:SRPBCC family protein n=1 Tax=Chryseobacterium sp. TaxID=1871047 RepID=UPI0025BDD237|nr:SRPBCC family protein [Chryseobacterium sp.]